MSLVDGPVVILFFLNVNCWPETSWYLHQDSNLDHALI